jgi:hypothetical protein
LLLGLLLSLALAELGVRAAGHRPWGRGKPRAQPPIHEPDEVLGWRNRAGEFVWPEGAPGTGPIRTTFWEGGLRATATERASRDRRALVLGCSFTQGWAVSDEETYAWRLQSTLPWIEVLNYGTAAYGTYQSLLALERYLASGEAPPEIVIYGFVPFHAERNVAAPVWVRGLTQVGESAILRVPYVTLDRRLRAERHAPTSYPRSVVVEWSAAAALAFDAGYELSSGDRADQARPVTRALLREMRRLTDRHGVALLAVLLARATPGEAKAWASVLSQDGIAMVDCSHPDQGTLDMQVPGYGHPNAEMNRHWAACLRRALRNRGLAAR